MNNNLHKNNKIKKTPLVYGGVIIFIVIALITIMMVVHLSNNVEASDIETKTVETFTKSEPITDTKSFVKPSVKVKTETAETEVYMETEAAETEVYTEIKSEESNDIRVLPNENVPIDYELQRHIEDLCAQYNVPIEVVLGCIQMESGFQDYAVNLTADCVGYMQINTCNWYWLNNEIGIVDLREPLQNIHSGIYILAYYHELYDDWEEVLVCYNNGEELARLYFFNEGFYSSAYSRTVMEYADQWANVIYR